MREVKYESELARSDNVQDLRIVNVTEGINTTLGNNDIEFIDLIEPSNNFEIKSRQVSGKFGSNKMGSQVLDTTLELKVRFRGNDPLDYFMKEQMLKKLLSVKSPISISPMYSYSSQYEFEKIGDNPDMVHQLYSLYTWDVLVNGSWNIDRNGLVGNASISLITENVPFRYTSEKIIDLSKPTSKVVGKYTYEFENDGTFMIDSKRFPMELRVTNIPMTSLEIITNDKSYRVDEPILSTNALIYNGYSTRLDGNNITGSTNYGEIYINEGFNKLELNVKGMNLLYPINGHFKFKQYVR